jgi:glycerol kinase
MGVYLAIDQGGHASRAMVFDAGGRELARASVPVATHRDPSGHVEHDPRELIASVRRAVAEVCAQTGGIVAAGLATQRSSIVCWNRLSGEALSPVISWQDRRHAAWLRQLEPRADWIRAHTGLVLSPHYGASKMRWCLDHLPAVQQARDRGELAIGPLSSFILFHLLAERPLVVDPANASRTQLWDPAARDWSAPLADLFGVQIALLPRCVTSRYAYGTLPTETGGIALTVATGDQSAAPFAFGPLDPGTVYVNAGTGAFVQRAIHGTPSDAPRMLASIIWSDESGVTYTLEGTVNGAGSALDWFAERERLDVQEWLSDREAPLNPPLFLNGVSGLGAPFWVSDLESRFLGNGTVRERFAAVLESIAFLIRVNVDELRLAEPPLRRLLLAGGLSASDRLCGALATLTRLPVVRSREPEATARGLAYLVAGEPAGWASAGDTFEPQPDPALAIRYPAWLQAMRAATPDCGYWR